MPVAWIMRPHFSTEVFSNVEVSAKATELGSYPKSRRRLSTSGVATTAFGYQGWIFRFVSILGERYTHGHVLDFYRQLLEHPDRLDVLGNGRQRKSYLYVQDCVSAILLAAKKCTAAVNILNLGTDEYCEVNDSIGWISAHVGVSPELKYAGGERGWVGDSPFIFLDCTRMRSLGWAPQLSFREGVVRTLEYLQQNRWVVERRK
jgi:UDP-glucose 4-epimerase